MQIALSTKIERAFTYKIDMNKMNERKGPDSLLRDQRFREAMHEYIQEFRRNADNTALSNIASCLYMLGKHISAEKLASRIIHSKRDQEMRSTLVLANIYLDRGNALDACKLYRRVAKGKLARHGYFGIAMTYLMRGRKDVGLRILKYAIRIYGEEGWPHLNQGLYYAKLNDFRNAWLSVSKSLEINNNCVEAWEAAYNCAINLNEYHTAKSIAKKLISLDKSVAKFYAYLGIAAYKIGDDPEETTDAYNKALSIDPNDISYMVNAYNPCYKIAENGRCANQMASKLKWTANMIHERITSGEKIVGDGRHPMVNSSFNIAYSPLNLKDIYGDYYRMLSLGFSSLIKRSLSESKALICTYNANLDSTLHQINIHTKQSRTRRIRIGFTSQNFYGHSNTQAFAGFFKYLDRSAFEVIIIHKPFTKPDSVQNWINSLADEVVYLGNSLAYAHATLCRLDLDVLFFTDLGMDPWDFILPEMRACRIQITGWGLPHTSGMSSIDYYLSSALLETTDHQIEYTEKLVLLDGLPCCFLSELLNYRIKGREYFMLPSNTLLIGCVQTLGKIHPDLDIIIEKVSKILPDAFFVFVCSGVTELTQKFLNRLNKRAPNAAKRVFMLNRCYTEDFLSLCDCLDILLDTPYYGAGVTAYMSAYVGTPTVCFKGKRLRDSTTSGIYKILNIRNTPVVSSIPEYVKKIIELGTNYELRVSIKKDTVEAAHRIYDSQDYIKSFELFCKKVVNKIPAC